MSIDATLCKACNGEGYVRVDTLQPDERRAENSTVAQESGAARTSRNGESMGYGGSDGTLARSEVPGEETLLDIIAEKQANGWEYGTHPRHKARIVLEAIRPFLRQPVRESGWQSIETAPKDGSRYLGHCGGEPFICYYDEDDGHICLHQTEIAPHRPKQWMPLPEIGEDESRRG